MERAGVGAIVPAAGCGRRMGGEIPKPYLRLGERPVLAHTLQCLEDSPRVDEVVLVVRAEDVEYCRSRIVQAGALGKVRRIVAGGARRCDSVRAGLMATGAKDGIVLVHDAVRPFVSEALIARVVEAARRCGAALAATPVKETIKLVEAGAVVRTPERARLWSAQTPQAFERTLLLRAFEAYTAGAEPTDEAMLVEGLGAEVRVVQGEYGNLKITTPEDLAWAQWRLRRKGS